MITWSMFLAICTQLAGVVAAYAAVVTSPEEICPASADPCLVTGTYEVDTSAPLDFGLRTVRVSGTGGFVGSLELACGTFESVVDPSDQWMVVRPADGTGSVAIAARRGCSLSPSTPCLDDASCAAASQGTCTQGSGNIFLSGRLSGASPSIMLRAAGDVLLEGSIRARGIAPEGYGGAVEVVSGMGVIDVAGPIDISAGRNDDYGGTGLSGSLVLRAPGNITLRNRVRAVGGAAEIDIESGQDVAIGAAIFAQGPKNEDWIGGTLELTAGRDLLIIDAPGAGGTRLNITGGSERSRYYGGTYAGPGGYGFLFSGRDLVLGPKVALLGDSGPSRGNTDDLPFSANWYFEAGGDVDIHGIVTSRGIGSGGYGLRIPVYADGDIRIAEGGLMTTTSASVAGPIALYGRNVTIDGRLDARGIGRSYGYPSGNGGLLRIDAENVIVTGDLVTGGTEYGGQIELDACRVRLQERATLDGRFGQQYEDKGYTNFYIGESMYAGPETKILNKAESSTRIVHRDAAKPPVLLGQVMPAAQVSVDASLSGCPVCGNSEIDQYETCDDGNVEDGDGCSADCQSE
ncbi:MAG TPA: hypothetical protein VEC57_02750 [Candidatus Limnocylindrales bacterium]|nr:hypothetical protein [Candidatus Limnocylindrales bacterium]